MGIAVFERVEYIKKHSHSGKVFPRTNDTATPRSANAATLKSTAQIKAPGPQFNFQTAPALRQQKGCVATAMGITRST